MAAAELRKVVGASACLCVLCGLPAAGKSTLACRITSTATELGWRAAVVQYDELIPDLAFHTKAELEDMHTNWKFHRQAVLQCIDGLVEKREMLDLPSCSLINVAPWDQSTQALLQPEGLKSDNRPLLFLLDDNFYYPSMRYEVYQLARKRSLGFCQVYLQCDLESCISRNQGRSRPVPTSVLLEMDKRLQPPDPHKNLWEIQTLTLNAAGDVSQSDVQKVIELISSAINNPLSPIEDNAEQKEADRLKCATSVVHQADQACRRLISEAMMTARHDHVPSELLRSLAAQLNEAKTTFLHDLRKNVLQEVLFIQNEDVDVDRVVKKAVESVFDQNKIKILATFLNK
uniref:Phosphoseryl-tRNA kinase n=1 Tax=Nothobranchius pienaari TaxID=704102 RepID=A0A1A8Q698_9TELE